jgi:hypothetical protein
MLYKASPGTWWIFEARGGHASELWATTAIVWQSGLFISMATRILQVLAGEVQERKAQRGDPDMPLSKENEMLIFVGMSLGRLLSAFELLHGRTAVLEQTPGARGSGGRYSCPGQLQAAHLHNRPHVQVRHNRAPPTSKTHERVDHENGRATYYITGIQTDPCSQYVQLTRATHETIVYLHDFPCGAPADKVQLQAGEVPPHLQTRLARVSTIATWRAGMTGSPWTATRRVHPRQSL